MITRVRVICDLKKSDISKFIRLGYAKENENELINVLIIKKIVKRFF